MKILKTGDDGFKEVLDRIVNRGSVQRADVEASVRNIIEQVKEKGDEAVVKFTKKFDNYYLSPENIRVSKEEIENAYTSVGKKELGSLKIAAERIRKFHLHQIEKSWNYEEDGVLLGQIIKPLSIVGVYTPGGKASYPSSVLMNVIPAKVAGVEKVIMCTPPSGGRLNPYVLVAADIGGVDEIFSVGGAQAIAAMAYGTETIPRVDKIVGPGNVYVAEAKRMVFGDVDIDMVAGPSEILIVNDGSGEPSWVAADLLSQAEHDELASGILLTTSRKMAEAVAQEVSIQIKHLKRQAIARGSIDRYGAIIITKDLNDAADISNQIAPEHLELFVRKPFKFLQKIKNAGAIFLGFHTPEALGDYMAGPNHTLPTGGTARFSSPLGVEDFIKRSSVLAFSTQGLKKLGRNVARFAEIEGLEAHGKSVLVRITAS